MYFFGTENGLTASLLFLPPLLNLSTLARPQTPLALLCLYFLLVQRPGFKYLYAQSLQLIPPATTCVQSSSLARNTAPLMGDWLADRIVRTELGLSSPKPTLPPGPQHQ